MQGLRLVDGPRAGSPSGTRVSQLLQDVSWFSVLDLKDTCVCVPLHTDDQFLFASANPHDQVQRESSSFWTRAFPRLGLF